MRQKITLLLFSLMMYICSHAQNVGIGTNTPVNKLSVVGKANITDSLGIGTATPAARLDVAGKVKINDGSQGAGKVLKSDANGIAGWDSSKITDFLSAPVPLDLKCPTNVGNVSVPLRPYSLAVSGNYAYVGCIESMQVINISNPAAPSVVGSVVTGSNPYSIAVSGNYAYLVNYSANNMQVIDILNPAAPSVVGSVATGSGPLSIAVSGNYAYVVNSLAHTMWVINISNPGAPVVVGGVATGNYPESVAVSGNFAYVINGSNDAIVKIDISNPVVPSVVATLPLGGGPRAIVKSGNYAYVANYNSNTMQVIQLDFGMSIVGTVGIYGAHAVAVSGKYAYVSSIDTYTMHVVDISNPAAPSVVNSVSTSGDATSLAISGNYAYVANKNVLNMKVFKLICADTLAITVNPSTGQTTTLPLQWNTSGNNISNRNSGNVGIGTATPTAKLHVAGNQKIDGINTLELGAGLTKEANAGKIGYQVFTNDALDIMGAGTTGSNRKIKFWNEGGASFEGNVGIGTSSPSNKLTVTGNANVTDNVGIGTATPTAKLHVAGNQKIDGINTLELGAGLTKENNAGKIGYQVFTNDALDIAGAGTTNTNRKIKFWAEGGATFNGYIGLGTSSPSAPLHITTTGPVGSLGTGYLYNPNGPVGLYSGGNLASILAAGTVIGGNFFAVSDARVKTVVGLSNSTNDLGLLNRLKVTDYTYIDKVVNDTRLTKKVIAQDVEQVLPNAVGKSKNFIPGIYMLAAKTTLVNGKLQLTLDKQHDLQSGDKLKWFDEKEQEQQSVVTAILSPNSFEIDHATGSRKAFIYGKEVDDFRTVDYEAIAMLNVSATQELYKMLLALKEENEKLKKDNSSLREDINEIKRRLNMDGQVTKTVEK